MNVKEFVKLIEAHDQGKNLEIVLFDCDTCGYYKLSPDNVELQRCEFSRLRISIGVNDFHDPRAEYPIERPV